MSRRGAPSNARLPGLGLLVLLFAGTLAGSSDAADQPNEKKKKKVRTVAVLIFEGVELLDFAGPAEVFIVADYGKSFRVITVAASRRPIKTIGGITVQPSHDFKTAPAADIVVVPGGSTAAVGKDGIAWLRKSSKTADVVMSVCFGAFLMARAGLLDDIAATTHHWAIDDLRRAAPKCKVQAGKRFVDSGKIITTAGVTAGIDGALHVVERLLGKEAARWTAEEWMEHRRSRRKASPAQSEQSKPKKKRS